MAVFVRRARERRCYGGVHLVVVYSNSKLIGSVAMLCYRLHTTHRRQRNSAPEFAAHVPLPVRHKPSLSSLSDANRLTIDFKYPRRRIVTSRRSRGASDASSRTHTSTTARRSNKLRPSRRFTPASSPSPRASNSSPPSSSLSPRTLPMRRPHASATSRAVSHTTRHSYARRTTACLHCTSSRLHARRVRPRSPTQVRAGAVAAETAAAARRRRA